MSKSNHTEGQMIGAIKQVEAGRKADRERAGWRASTAACARNA